LTLSEFGNCAPEELAMPRSAKPKSTPRVTKAKANSAIRGGKGRSATRDGAGKQKTSLSPDSTSDDNHSPYPTRPRPPHRWTFLTNHAHVLVLLKAQPELILREVATRVGITERAVQRIIQDLESAGFIQRQKVGRQNQYQVMTEQPLRHPIEAHRKIGDLLKLING
jgi:predicted transcriptional regulator